MAQFSMNELTTYRWSFEQDVLRYAEAGLSAIAVWRQKLSEFGDQKGVELIADRGLKVSSLMWAGGFTGSEGRSYKESIEDAHEAIDLARDLQANCLIVYSGTRAGHTHNHARRLLTNALQELLPHAAEANTTLALEPMHEQSASAWTFLTDLDETKVMVDKLDSDRLKLSFDTYHFGGDPQTVERLAELAPRLAIVELGDARKEPDAEQERCPLGSGIIPLKTIVQSLTDAGFDGYFDVKLMGQEIETMDYGQLLCQTRQVVSELTGTAAP